MPIELQTATPASEASTSLPGLSGLSFRRAARVTTRDRMFFTERLALLLEAGTPLHSSLDTIAGQIEKGALGPVCRALSDDVASGMRFSQALARQSEAFPAAYVSLIGAAEEGGFMAEVLARLREMDERRQELRATLTGACAYPAFLLVLSMSVVIFVLVRVFPKFSELFSSIANELPVTTRVLLAASDLMRAQWPLLLAGTAVGGFLVFRWLTSATGRDTLDRLGFSTPGIRDLVVQYHLVQFMHVMALSLANGVPLLDALRSCREVVASPRFRTFLTGLEKRVLEGRGIASGFAEASFLPALARQLVATGEEAGRLGLVMGRIASFYEREWRQRLETATKLVEPLMLLLMGVVVGLIVASLILPIFKLSRTVH